jgi:hypothetical protein
MKRIWGEPSLRSLAVLDDTCPGSMALRGATQRSLSLLMEPRRRLDALR